MRTRRIIVMMLGILGMLVASGAMVRAESPPEGNALESHCPNHQGHPNKVENPAPGSVHKVTVDGTDVWLHFSEDLHSVEFYADEAGTTPIAVEYCIKASNKAGGKETGHEGQVWWTNGGGRTPQISYVVVYRIVDTGCPDGQVEDSVTGECGPPCPDGSAPADGVCPSGENAECRARAVKVDLDSSDDDADIVLFEANPPLDPCATDVQGINLPPGEGPYPLRVGSARTNGDETSADAELIGLGGEGFPGGVSVLGAHADCDNRNAWVLSLDDGSGEPTVIGDEPGPLNMDGQGVFLARTDERRAQAGVVALGPIEIAVVEAEAAC